MAQHQVGEENAIAHYKQEDLTELSLRFHLFSVPSSPPAPASRSGLVALGAPARPARHVSGVNFNDAPWLVNGGHGASLRRGR
jgi:hypothetical protein